MTLHLALLIAYCVVIMGMGLLVGRQTKTKGDFFVAGRSLGPGLLFATLVAANIGAGSTVGASGLGYRDGLSAWWWVGSAALGSLVQAFLVGPKMRRIAADRGLHTVGDFLEYRYGRNVRGIVSSLLWWGRWPSWPDRSSPWGSSSTPCSACPNTSAACWAGSS